MKTSIVLLPLLLLTAVAAPVHAMTGCDFVDGTHESIAFALLALDARQRGEEGHAVLARAVPEKSDPAWHAAMARETVAEVFSDLRPIEPAVYSVYRGMVCYHAAQRPAANVVVDYAAIHPALAACESRPTPREQGQCAGEALDNYFDGTAK